MGTKYFYVPSDVTSEARGWVSEKRPSPMHLGVKMKTEAQVNSEASETERGAGGARNPTTLIELAKERRAEELISLQHPFFTLHLPILFFYLNLGLS